MPIQHSVIQRGSIIYLNVNGTWYCYDERSEPLGAGAMGVVYAGTSTDGKIKVAIKRVIDKYANIRNIRERAKMEASLMFRHHNLVEMIGYCEAYSDHGPIFIISKYVSGSNIDAFIQQLNNNKQRVHRICEMMYSVMDALEYIHSKGIIHMDIKPSNIMVENGNNVRLMDLGIAYVDDRINAADSTSSALMGTPKYAAPEQFGKVAPHLTLNSSTDIYELGITIYELLAGENPFQATNIQEAVQKRRSSALPYSNKIPRAVVDVLRTATTFNQKGRYQSIADFKSALSQALYVKPKKKVPISVIISFCLAIFSFFLLFTIILIKWNT